MSVSVTRLPFLHPNGHGLLETLEVSLSAEAAVMYTSNVVYHIGPSGQWDTRGDTRISPPAEGPWRLCPRLLDDWELAIPEPNRHLGVGSASHGEQAALMFPWIETLAESLLPVAESIDANRPFPVVWHAPRPWGLVS